MLEFGWEQGFGRQQPHPTSNTPTHTDMLHSWPTESGFTYKRVGVMWKFYILLGRKSVSVSMYIQYVYGAAGWQCCTAQRTGWIIPAPSKDPHLRSSGHDTYSESPKLSHTPWGQQRPTRKSERNREIGGGGCDGRREGVEAERRNWKGAKKVDDSRWLKGGDNVSWFKCFF